MLNGSLFTTTWHVLRLRMEETAFRCGGYLQIYRISSRAQHTRGDPPAWGMGVGLTAPHRKKISLLRKITRSLGPGRGPVEGSYEHGNEPLGSIKCWEVFE
jgi:hypothetical protein